MYLSISNFPYEGICRAEGCASEECKMLITWFLNWNVVNLYEDAENTTRKVVYQWDVCVVQISSRKREKSREEKNYRDFVGGLHWDVVIQAYLGVLW